MAKKIKPKKKEKYQLDKAVVEEAKTTFDRANSVIENRLEEMRFYDRLNIVPKHQLEKYKVTQDADQRKISW